ncbi:ABC transporter ATP-binding protein [Synechococcus sp. PCC 6312]|uniref:ABC transporter ATP-binding protein n=1 Tax=Synechococcus sp. (strain ATCC 27167 / PCC 6312) TaxID=195253 RepID=UPI002110B764|nr:ABC transporter ATP-binding protein [Synechococcus sp. PCC 6312]
MKTRHSLKLWQFYLSFYERRYGKLSWSIFLSFLQSLMVLPSMYLARAAFDWAIPSRSLVSLFQVGLGMLLFSLLSATIALTNRYLTLIITKTAILKMRVQLLERLFIIPREIYRQSDYVHWHTTIVQDTERLDIMSNNSLTVVLPSVVTTISLVILLWYWNPLLLALMALISPLAFIYNYYARRKLKYTTPLFLRAFEQFSKGILFTIRSLDLIHIQSAQEWEWFRQKESIKNLYHKSIQVAWLNSAYTLTQNNLLTIAKLILLIGGGWAVIGNTISLGELIGFYIATNLLQTALQSILGTIPVFISGQASLDNIYRFFHYPISQPYNGQIQVDWQGKLSLTAITFSHGKTPILSDLSLTLWPGQVIVILGPNGCGKSTLIDLILGFYRPNSGEIVADELSYRDIDIASFRQRIGVVRQENFFFPGTVWENLTYGLNDHPESEVNHVLEIAMADYFIQQLPQGLQTKIGEDGNLLSGGQRQRLALARSLLRYPKMLILDEPTNHLDQEAIAELMANLKKVQSRPGILIVSHNLKLTEQADQVLEMNDGKLRLVSPLI